MPDVAWCSEKADEATDTGHHGRCPQHRGQLLRRFHPILERDDPGGWSHQWADGFRRLGHLPGFDGDEDDIHHADLLWVVRGLHRVETKPPSTLSTRSPWVCTACRCVPRAIKVISAPACAKRPPK